MNVFRSPKKAFEYASPQKIETITPMGLAENDDAFLHACSNGHLDVALEKISHASPITMARCFNSACCRNLSIAQWLYSVNPDICEEHDIYFSKEQFFTNACSNGHLDVAQWLLTVKPDLNINKDAWVSACAKGELEVAQWLLTVKPDLDISADDEGAFRHACSHGYLDVAQWLLNKKPTLDVSARDEEAFRDACTHGHLAVAQWIYSVKPTLKISAKGDYLFPDTCCAGHLEVAQWLASLCPDRYIITSYEKNNNPIINPNKGEWIIGYERKQKEKRKEKRNNRNTLKQS